MVDCDWSRKRERVRLALCAVLVSLSAGIDLRRPLKPPSSAPPCRCRFCAWLPTPVHAVKQFLSLGDQRNHIRYCQPVPPASLTTSPENPKQPQRKQPQEDNDAVDEEALYPLFRAPQSVRATGRREGDSSGREMEAPFPGSAVNGGDGWRKDGGDGSIDVGGGDKANDSGRRAEPTSSVLVDPSPVASSAKPVDGKVARPPATGEVSTSAGGEVKSAAKRKREGGGDEADEEGAKAAASKRKREGSGVDCVSAGAAPSGLAGAAGSGRVDADRGGEKNAASVSAVCAARHISNPAGDAQEKHPKQGVAAADAEVEPAAAVPHGGSGSVGSSSATAGGRGAIIDLANDNAAGGREASGAPGHRPGSAALPLSLKEAESGKGKGAHEKTAGETRETKGRPEGVRPPALEDDDDGRGAEKPNPALGSDSDDRKETLGAPGGGGSSDGGNGGSGSRRGGQLRIQAAVVPSGGGGCGGRGGGGRIRNRLRSNSGSSSNSSSSSGGNGIVSGEGSRGTKRSREEGGWHAAAAAAAAAAGDKEKERRTKSPRR